MDSDAFLAVMAGHDPATGRDLGRRFGDGSVRGYDATFSAPKSVSVLFGLGEPEVRRQVVEAHESAVRAVLGWVETRAHTRMRTTGTSCAWMLRGSWLVCSDSTPAASSTPNSTLTR